MPRKIPINKTGRIRGLIRGHIRDIIERKKQVKPSEVVGGPVKDRSQAQYNLFQMFREGELERVRRGAPRCSYSIEAIYAKIDHLNI